ncbi:putative bifunctional diguanylate cyclase/phosphodiesterase [Cellulomonas sp. NS3]|uniref:putative bifunctional diguanylate cyclase/phosphodiesterase n=1 Tax=Cellulomonas sp. NS3 TaxID=2973977 RepID=UPI00216158A3|nr:bifunctional diguanylate cyclase/phosphodiesterase [Cellulomonas sp. NS3]
MSGAAADEGDERAGSPPAWHVHAEAYAALFERSTDGLVLTSPRGDILAANPAACRMLGRSEPELRGLGRVGVIDPADERWERAVAVRNAEGWFQGELRARRADGSTFPVDLSSAVVTADTAIVLFRDLTHVAEAVERAEDARRAAATVIDLLETISEGYFALDDDWRFSYVNRQGERIMGVERGDVLGRVFWEVFPQLLGSRLEVSYRHVLATGEPVEFEGSYGPERIRCEVRAHRLPSGGMCVYFRDIVERHAAQREREELLARQQAARAAAEEARAAAEEAQRVLTEHATHDTVTGLLNRWGLLREVRRLGDGEASAPGLVLLFIDLDRFKLVNDTLGHVAGDQVLSAVAERLRELIGPRDLLARFGGDEFVVVLPGASATAAEALARRIVDSGDEPVVIGSTLLPVTASIGLAHAHGADEIDTLLREADAALHRVKAGGRDGFTWFDEVLHQQTVQRVATELELRRGLTAGDGLVLHYQPAFGLGRRPGVAHVEALARWSGRGPGLVPPAEFIPVAEESGLIVALGAQVVARAVEQIARWSDRPGVRVWVNVSPRQLALPGLADLLARRLDEAGVAADRLGIEVTEQAMDDGRLVAHLEAVRRLGVAVAIDDFGTGYSSLSRLAQAPVDVIKVDRSFVLATGTPKGRAVVDGIVRLAHSIGAHVIAEGIETPEQLDAISAVGADAATGFLLARPEPAEAVAWESRFALKGPW